MTRYFRRLNSLTSLFGFDARKLAASFRGLRPFWRDYGNLRRQYRISGKEFPFGRFYPALEDRFSQSGSASGHYFHQDLQVAQWIFADKPVCHVDVGSRMDGFVAHVASFRPIEVFDIRPLTVAIPQIKFTQCDFMTDRFLYPQYCDSASCLHALEHFGLGRYGDTPDYYGYQRGWQNLHCLLKPKGRLYFSVPMGPQRIEFNGHRVFSMLHLLSMIKDKYQIERFAYVNDAGDLVPQADPFSDQAARNFDCGFGCAIFSLIKLDQTV